MLPEPVRLALDGHARPEILDALHGLLGRAWTLSPAVAAPDRMAMELAVAEIATNMVEHCADRYGADGYGADGYGADGRGVGEGGPGMVADIAVHADRIEVDLVDSGRAAVVDPATARLPDDPFAQRGRGLALVRAVADEVSYVRDGERNRWRITRLRSAAPPTAGLPAPSTPGPTAPPTAGACAARTA